jgi:hypothetical protein
MGNQSAERGYWERLTFASWSWALLATVASRRSSAFRNSRLSNRRFLSISNVAWSTAVRCSPARSFCRRLCSSCFTCGWKRKCQSCRMAHSRWIWERPVRNPELQTLNPPYAPAPSRRRFSSGTARRLPFYSRLRNRDGVAISPRSRQTTHQGECFWS